MVHCCDENIHRGRFRLEDPVQRGNARFQKLPFIFLIKVTMRAERYDRSSLSDHDGNAGIGIIQREQNPGYNAKPPFLHRQVHRFLPFPSSPSFTSLPSAPFIRLPCSSAKKFDKGTEKQMAPFVRF